MFVLKSFYGFLLFSEGCVYVCIVKNVHRCDENINVGLNLKSILTTSLLSPPGFPIDVVSKQILLDAADLFKCNMN